MLCYSHPARMRWRSGWSLSSPLSGSISVQRPNTPSVKGRRKRGADFAHPRLQHPCSSSCTPTSSKSASGADRCHTDNHKVRGWASSQACSFTCSPDCAGTWPRGSPDAVCHASYQWGWMPDAMAVHEAVHGKASLAALAEHLRCKGTVQMYLRHLKQPSCFWCMQGPQVQCPSEALGWGSNATAGSTGRGCLEFKDTLKSGSAGKTPSQQVAYPASRAGQEEVVAVNVGAVAVGQLGPASAVQAGRCCCVRLPRFISCTRRSQVTGHFHRQHGPQLVVHAGERQPEACDRQDGLISWLVTSDHVTCKPIRL